MPCMNMRRTRVRIVLPGMVYRYEQMDASHEIQFNQIELLRLAEISPLAICATLEEFIRRMFGSGVEHGCAHPTPSPNPVPK